MLRGDEEKNSIFKIWWRLYMQHFFKDVTQWMPTNSKTTPPLNLGLHMCIEHKHNQQNMQSVQIQ
jgi:hypothetical protein